MMDQTKKREILKVIRSGNISRLKKLHNEGIDFNNALYTLESAEYGNLEILVYLHENGCHWNPRACDEAASNGHFECLIHLHENGCHWDENTTLNSKMNINLNCYNYAIENGCPEY